jgi:predicted type IV restriction endonuclease
LATEDFSPEDEEELVRQVVVYSLELVCLGYQMLDKCWVHPTEAN